MQLQSGFYVIARPVFTPVSNRRAHTHTRETRAREQPANRTAASTLFFYFILIPSPADICILP